MVQFYQTTACVLVAVILILTLRKQGNEFALVLSVLLCCMVGFMAAGFLEPVVRFMQRLQKIGALNQELLNILLKIVGICFTAEIAGLICEDSGNGALGKALQFLASAVILYLSLPLLSKLLDIVEGMLDNL